VFIINGYENIMQILIHNFKPNAVPNFILLWEKSFNAYVPYFCRIFSNIFTYSVIQVPGHIIIAHLIWLLVVNSY